MNYKITLKTKTSEYTGNGKTLTEALDNLEKPETFKTLASLKVECGKKKTERIMNIPKQKMLFYKDQYRMVLAKSLERFLK